jgi:acyl-CoA thioesterase-1
MDSDENFSSMLHRNMALNTITLFSKWTSLSLLLICVSLFSCKNGSSEQTAQQSTNKVEEEQVDNTATSGNKVILFYGNSLTAGYGLDENESFPSLIEDKIDSLNLPYSVVNAGLSGETTSGGLKRIDWVMKQKVDIFFLELGANDMLRGLPLDQTKTNLSEIISIVKAKNPNVVIGLCEMMAPPNMGEVYVSEFSKIYQDLSDAYDVKFIPFFLEGVAGNPDLLLKDGKHPNANGQVIVAENIWKHLEPML